MTRVAVPAETSTSHKETADALVVLLVCHDIVTVSPRLIDEPASVETLIAAVEVETPTETSALFDVPFTLVHLRSNRVVP